MKNVKPKQLEKHWAKPTLFKVILALLACTSVLLAYFVWRNHYHKPNTSAVSPQAAKTQLFLAKNAPFQHLRHVVLLDNRFVVLKHIPTSQRVVLLSGGNQGNKTAYHTLFHQNLSATQFTLFLHAFKHGTAFEHASIRVNSVSLHKTNQLKHQDILIIYKDYIVSTLIDGQPEAFEAYVGEIQENGQTKGLVFTFNSKNHISMQPLSDLSLSLETVRKVPYGEQMQGASSTETGVYTEINEDFEQPTPQCYALMEMGSRYRRRGLFAQSLTVGVLNHVV